MIIKLLSLLLAASTTFLVSGTLLIWVVARLLRSNRAQLIAVGPLVEEQEFAIAEAAPLLLIIEVPRVESEFRKLCLRGNCEDRAIDQIKFRFLSRAGNCLWRDDDACAVGPYHCVTAGSASRTRRRFAAGNRLFPEPGHALAALSRPYGAADHRHRYLRNRLVAESASRAVAGVANGARMNVLDRRRRKPNARALFGRVRSLLSLSLIFNQDLPARHDGSGFRPPQSRWNARAD